MGGAQGQAEDIRVEVRQVVQIHENLVRMYARMTGKEQAEVKKDLARDNFMSAEEAKEYGIIDQVIKLKDMSLPAKAAAPNAGEAPAKAPAEAASPQVPQQEASV